MAYGSLSAAADATKQLAIDLISGALFQRVKMAFGIEGSAVDVSASNPLPTTDAGAATASAAILAKLPTAPALDATVAAVTAKLSADPATQTGLTAILTKLPAAPALDATLLAQSNKLPASLGAKAGTASLSIVPASDATFNTVASGQPSVTIATAVGSIAATTGYPASTPWIANVPTGSYLFDAVFTGTSLLLQRQLSDGSTWATIGTLTASGSVGVVIGNLDTIRIYNPNSTAVTTVTAKLK